MEFQKSESVFDISQAVAGIGEWKGQEVSVESWVSNKGGLIKLWEERCRLRRQHAELEETHTNLQHDMEELRRHTENITLIHDPPHPTKA